MASPTPDQKSICVYCSSSNAVPEEYKSQARALGELFAHENWHMVYGGGKNGLMGITADSALENGTQVTGIIPAFLAEKEVAHTGLTTLHITQTLHERQTRMAKLSEGFIILPGGLGTLAEFFEILTWKQLGHHNKPIILLNTNNYWDPLTEQINKAKQNGCIYEETETLFTTVDEIEKIPPLFRSS